MKKSRSKKIVYVFVALFFAIVSCSKTESKSIVPDPETGTPSKPVQEDTFTPQTVGFSNKKLVKPTDIITDYVVYIPEGYNEKKDYKWPVVFFLHGIGERGKDISAVRQVGLSRVMKGKQFIMVAPLCNNDWWNSAALEVLYKEVMDSLHVDKTKVYLTGLSMGGYGTWDWGSLHSEHFAALVPICGAGTVSRMSRLQHTPVWVFHSADDPTVNVNESRTLVNELKRLGADVQYTEYPDGGHDAWTRAYNTPELYTWLLKQHK